MHETIRLVTVDPRICEAITNRNLLMFGYRGQTRVVEPHLYGRTTAGNDALSAWLRPGWSKSTPDGGWRMFLVDEMQSIGVLPRQFESPRPNFNPADAVFVTVYCTIQPEAAPVEPANS
jgi:hypothetical protein